MNYGIAFPNGDVQMFKGHEAAGEARGHFIVARGAAMAGETLRLFSATEAGVEVTLVRVTVH